MVVPEMSDTFWWGVGLGVVCGVYIDLCLWASVALCRRLVWLVARMGGRV